jgi:hypothetical protein
MAMLAKIVCDEPRCDYGEPFVAQTKRFAAGAICSRSSVNRADMRSDHEGCSRPQDDLHFDLRRLRKLALHVFHNGICAISLH